MVEQKRYYDKGGHLARAIASKAHRAFERLNPDFHSRAPLPVPAELTTIRRAKMYRDVRDGRR